MKHSSSWPRRPGDWLPWLSGADLNVLRYVERDRARQAGVGAVILIGSLVPAVLAGYATQMTLRLPLLASFAVGLGWGLVTLVWDRSMITTGRHGDGVIHQLASVIPRIVLAVVSAGILSVPVVLTMFSAEIENEMTVMRAAQQMAYMTDIDKSARYSAIGGLESRIAQLQKTVDGGQSIEDNPSVAVLRAQVDSLTAKHDAAVKAARCEKDGTCGSGRAGGGPSYQDKLAAADRLAGELAAMQARLADARSAAEDERKSAEQQLATAKAQLALLQHERATDLAVRASLEGSSGLLVRLTALNRLAGENGTVTGVHVTLLVFLAMVNLLPTFIRLRMGSRAPTLHDQIFVRVDRDDPLFASADVESEVRRHINELGSRPLLSEAEIDDWLAQVRQHLTGVLAGRRTAHATVGGPATQIGAGAGAGGGGGGTAPEPAAGSAGDDGRDRFLVGELPTAVRIDQEFSLVARIVVDQPSLGVRTAAMPDLRVGPQGVDVVLLVHPDAGLAGTEALQTTVHVPFRSGSQPARFSLRATTVGLRHLRLSAWIGGTSLAELELEVSAEDRPVREASQRRLAPITGLRAAPGEVTMQVNFDGARYSFQLHAPSFWSEPVLAESLTDSPGVAVERTVDMLRRFAAAKTSYTPATAHRWVKETGVGLWQDLVPGHIKDAFWSLHGDIGTFTIACVNDTVPWELMYPLSRQDDHGFLAQQFPVVRRLLGHRSALSIGLDQPQFVVPPRAPANAQAEVATLRRVLGQAESGGADLSALETLMDLLDSNDAGLLHFACHNTFSLERGGSSIEMDGGAFLPVMLNSAVTRQSLAARNPLVFVNACRSAGVAPEFTRMMGWASQFMRAGAGAFVGTLWPVSSERASTFAEAFYSELTGGTALGAATLSARQATKDEGDPTWLAYTIYGDPAATAGHL